MSGVRVQNITMKFGDFTAVSDVSFEAPAGSFVTLLGPSGCGKTTLLKTIAGFNEPTAGRVWINDVDVTDLPPEARDTAMCFQSYALFPHLKVEENIGFGPKQQRLPRSQREQRIEEAVRQVDLGAHLGKLPNALSGGQQQRVALARAIAMKSSVVLFDEPLSNLDAKLRDSVREEIRSLQRDQDFTAVYVTHDQAEALALSDVIIVMRNGKIEQMGAPADIYNHPKTKFVADFIGTANIMSAQAGETKIDRISTVLGDLVCHAALPDDRTEFEICWRPEAAEIASQATRPGGDNWAPVKVQNSVFLGNLTQIVVAPSAQPDTRFRLEVPGTSDLEEGQTIHIRVPPEKLVILESGE